MTTNLTTEKARERKAELLHTFIRMVDYAVEQDVQAVIIAGDLFDGNKITQTTRNAVYDQISAHPFLDFYYLQGNHDSKSFLTSMEQVPDNLKLFDERWRTYCLNPNGAGNVSISGVELNRENCDSVCHSLVLDADNFNIVVMHGQESERRGKDKTEIIALKDLRNKGIDYLALGHIHKYKEEKLDSRGVYCYCGCLEGRGFDECGEHGFVLLDIDEVNKTCRRTFIPFACRQLEEVTVNISECLTSSDITNRIGAVLQEEKISSRNLVKVVLTGEVDVDCEKDMDLLCKRFQDSFYFLKMEDASKWKVDYQAYALDVSLKGEFIRAVCAAQDIAEEDKATVIRYGICALADGVETLV